MDAKQRTATKQLITATIADHVDEILKETGFAFEALVKEGVLVTNGDAYVVISAIVKAEEFDPSDAIQEYNEALEARAKKESEKAKKVEKAKSKKKEEKE